MTVPITESNSWFPEMHRRITTLTAERDALQQRVGELEAHLRAILRVVEQRNGIPPAEAPESERRT